jgi:hypothetical protein
LRPDRTELQRARERKQHPRAAAGIIWRTMAERRGNADVGLPASEFEAKFLTVPAAAAEVA